MSTFQFNIYLPVSDYRDWDDCQADVDFALECAKDEMANKIMVSRLPDMNVSAKFDTFTTEDENTASGVFKITATFNTDTMNSKDLCNVLRLSLMMEVQ